MTELPTRGDVGLKEATRDPIFLFQSKRQVWTERDLPDGWTFDDDFNIVDETGADVSEDDPRLRKSGKVGDYWRTESVFFTRKEGEAYGRARAYNYPNGWRVYCVCAEGELAELLRARSLAPTGTLRESEAFNDSLREMD